MGERRSLNDEGLRAPLGGERFPHLTAGALRQAGNGRN